jgi:hypothetical protein
MVLCFETQKGSIFMNIALRYNLERQKKRTAASA